MIIDTHTHIGRNKHINATVDELLRSMDAAGIDKSLIFAGTINDCPNEYLFKQIVPHKDRLLAVAGYDPLIHSPDDHKHLIPESFRDLYLEKRFVAVKFYVGYDHYYPNEVDYSPLEDVGCPAIFHCGDCLSSVQSAKLKYAHPLGVDDVAVDYPDLPIVIAHCGFPFVREAAEVCYKNKNVYADMSGFVYGKFTLDDRYKFNKMLREFIDIAGPKKLLFGSDWPISDQTSYVDAARRFDIQNSYMDYWLENAVKLFSGYGGSK